MVFECYLLNLKAVIFKCLYFPYSTIGYSKSLKIYK